MSTLDDNGGNGDLDDALSGTLSVSDPGFGAEWAAGAVGSAQFSAGADLAGASLAGWRGLADPADLAWIDGTVANGSGTFELAVALDQLYPGGLSGAQSVGIVVRVTNGFGDAYPNQALPPTESAGTDPVQESSAVLALFPLE
jgi:hypothetical protein